MVRDKIGITDGTVKDGYPVPDLIWTTHLCNLHSKWYQEVSRLLGGVPMYSIDMIGGGDAEKDPKIVNYVCDQMEVSRLASKPEWDPALITALSAALFANASDGRQQSDT